MRAVREMVLGVMLGLLAEPAAFADLPRSAEVLDHGRALYRGTTALLNAPRVGDTILPVVAAACANCHGARGQGGAEAGVTAPAISWRRLMEPREGHDAYGSKERIAQAIEEGTGRGGVRLLAPMPAYALTESEREAVLAYLGIIGTEADQAQGVFTDRILVGALLPLQGDSRSQGERIQTGIREYFETVNRKGGIFGRRVELIVEDAGTSANDAVRGVERLIRERQVFALVGSMLPEVPVALWQTIHRYGTPLVATLGIPLRDSTERKLTYALPSIERQVQQLLGEIGRHCDIHHGFVALHVPAAGLGGAIEGAFVKGAVDASFVVRPVRGQADVDAQLRGTTAQVILALAPGSTVRVIRKQLHAEARPHCLATLAMFSGTPFSGSEQRDLATPTRHVKEVVGLPMPSSVVSSGQPLDGEGLWTLLGDWSARIFVEALSRTGRIVDHEEFDRALDSLYGFEPIKGLRANYSVQQRHGLSVAYIWRGTSHE